MNRMTIAILCASSLTLGGCLGFGDDKSVFDPPKPLDKMTTQEWCDYHVLYLSNPGISLQSRQIATGQMRRRGCPNTPA